MLPKINIFCLTLDKDNFKNENKMIEERIKELGFKIPQAPKPLQPIYQPSELINLFLLLVNYQWLMAN